MKKFPPLILLLFVASLNACSSTPKSVTEVNRGISITEQLEVKRFLFSNGLRLLVLEDNSSPTFAYQTWFNVGSRNEVPGKTGLAHLFEHMMFKGTKAHPDGEFDSILEQAGVEGENAFTTTDNTVYVQELPKEHLDLIISLESDRMVNLVVNDASFKTERSVVQNERRMRKENSPEGTIYQTMFETAFTESPYHWPVIGYEQDLNLMNAQDARDFYQKYYSPDRAIIVVVGDVKASEVAHKIEKAYSTMPAKNTPDGEMIQEPTQTAQKRRRIELNIQSDKLWIGYKVPPFTHEDTAALELVQAILSDGKNSRLTRALVSTGVSTNVDSGSFGLKDPGLFMISTDLQKGRDASLAENIILREIDRLKAQPVSIEELNRAKNLIRFQFYKKLSTASGKARFLGEFESKFGNFSAGSNLQNLIKKITPEQVQEVVRKYFEMKRATFISGVPKNENN